MKIIPKKYTLLALAGILVVTLGIMAYTLRPKLTQKELTTEEKEIKQIQIQSPSDETGAIEKDLNETDLSNLDKELRDIDKELGASY